MDLKIGDDRKGMDDFKLGLAVGTILGAVEATFLIVVLNIVIETIIQKGGLNMNELIVGFVIGIIITAGLTWLYNNGNDGGFA